VAEQERLSVLNEVEQIIQDELRKIIGDRKQSTIQQIRR
jgi:hypothetical protein